VLPKPDDKQDEKADRLSSERASLVSEKNLEGLPGFVPCSLGRSLGRLGDQPVSLIPVVCCLIPVVCCLIPVVCCLDSFTNMCPKLMD
jgi:hypothetical protein